MNKMNKINMLKSVYFLYTQVPQERFNMSHYRGSYKNKKCNPNKAKCETVGCAAGHLTAIVPKEKIKRMVGFKCIWFYGTISEVLSIPKLYYMFLFSEIWIDFDNTVEGACKRFLYLLITKKPELEIKANHSYHKIDIKSTYNRLKSKYEK